MKKDRKGGEMEEGQKDLRQWMFGQGRNDWGSGTPKFGLTPQLFT